MSAPSHDLDALADEVRHHRQRYDLYRAKMYGLRAFDQSRLRELQRFCESAELRLAAAKAKQRAAPAD